MSKKITSHTNDALIWQDNKDGRKLKAVLRDGEKIFVKKYRNLTDVDVERLFDKYRYFYDNLPFDVVRTPEPIRCYGNVIEFEYVELPKRNRLNMLLKQGGSVRKKALEQSARALQIIHRVGDSKNYNHGDYWFGNVYLFDEHVYVIDFEAPLRLVRKSGDWKILKSKEFDIALFFDWYFSLHDTVLKRYYVSNYKCFRHFISAYQKAGGKFNTARYKVASRLLWRDFLYRLITADRTSVYKIPLHLLLFGVSTVRNWRFYI